MNIRCYLKPSCGWSNGVRAIMAKYALNYQDVDIINSPTNYAEMVEKTGQRLSPCVEIDGVMLPDISGAEVEQFDPHDADIVQPFENGGGDGVGAFKLAERIQKQAAKLCLSTLPTPLALKA